MVATQSIATLSALLAARLGQPFRLELNFLALSMWLWGGMLYIWMMSLIFYRYTFFTLEPGDLSPPYWINMGAMAISMLAGSVLILNSPDAPFLLSLLPFLKGFTVFYWATGTWWIPMLLVLALWRHVYRRFPLRYDPLYWGAVFPLGMYAASTHRMIEAMRIEFLHFLPPLFFGVALAAWTAAFAGLMFVCGVARGTQRGIERGVRGLLFPVHDPQTVYVAGAIASRRQRPGSPSRPEPRHQNAAGSGTGAKFSGSPFSRTWNDSAGFAGRSRKTNSNCTAGRVGGPGFCITQLAGSIVPPVICRNTSNRFAPSLAPKS